MVFADYARYYNLIYSDKNYREEVDYIDSLIKKYSRGQVRGVLELGCGTGNHASFLTDKNYTITGVDVSDDMIKIAKGISNPLLEFHHGDARSIRFDKTFDAVVSLFHVASYQNSDADFSAFIGNAARHLGKDGLFIFDFWYGPAVLNDLPAVRVKRLEDEHLRVTRIAEPIVKEDMNIVEVHYEIIVEDKMTSMLSRLKEIHSMRYFFMPEIRMFLESHGFELVDSMEWLTEKKPWLSSWNVVSVGRRK